MLNPWNIDALREIEKETGKRVSTILQLRLHPSVIALKKKLENSKQTKKLDVDLTYITSRGQWYQQSWKGDIKKSGGIATNIGVHFFDLLHHLFGSVQDCQLHMSTPSTAAGFLEFELARVRWFLSIDVTSLPADIRLKGQRTYRSLKLNNEEFEFSGGFTDLHTESYKNILEGKGFTLEDNRVAIETVAQIRNLQCTGKRQLSHPFAESSYL